MSAHLDELRQQIDEVDDEILHLLARRADIVAQIRRVKEEFDLPKHDPERFAQLLQERQKLATELHLEPSDVEKIWDILHNMALKIEEEN